MSKLIRCDSRIFPLSSEERAIYHRAGIQVNEIEDLSVSVIGGNRDAAGVCVVSSKARADVIDHLPDLQVISRFGSGTDNIDMEAASRNGVVVTRVPDFCLAEVAEHTMALLLASARKLPHLDLATRSGDWTARVTGGMRRVEGKQLGLIGFGLIAQQVARRAKPFGIRLAAHDPYAPAPTLAGAGIEPMGLDELLQTSDFVSLHVPLTPATRHMIGEGQLRMMKPGAVLINTSRGAVVDESALVAALSADRLGGAALDVYEGLNMFGPAPDSVDHPLFHLSNVLLTPHAAACSQEALAELMSAGARNAVAVLQGTAPENCVNPEVLPVARFRLREKSAATK